VPPEAFKNEATDSAGSHSRVAQSRAPGHTAQIEGMLGGHSAVVDAMSVRSRIAGARGSNRGRLDWPAAALSCPLKSPGDAPWSSRSRSRQRQPRALRARRIPLCSQEPHRGSAIGGIAGPRTRAETSVPRTLRPVNVGRLRGLIHLQADEPALPLEPDRRGGTPNWGVPVDPVRDSGIDPATQPL
jgi:hypothetical protein